MTKTLRRRIVVAFAAAALIASCTKSTSEAVPAAKQSGSATAPTPTTKPAAASGHDDVTFDSDSVQIGAAPMQIGDDTSLGAVALSLRGNVVVAEDSHSVRTWDLTSGEPTKLIPPIDDDPAALTPRIVLANDGSALAIGSTARVRVVGKRDVDINACTTPGAFSHDAKLLVCLRSAPEVWNVVDNKLVAKAPDHGLDMIQAAQFTADDKAVTWANHHEIVRWDFARGTLASVYKSADDMRSVVFAAGGGYALVATRAGGATKFASVVVDLASGHATLVGESFTGAVSADGSKVVVLARGEVQLVEVASKKLLWSGTVATPVQRIAFASDGDSFAYVESGHIHIFDGKGIHTYTAPSRFAGWASEGGVAIERAGVLEQLTLASHAWSALGSRPPGDHVDGAPAWATWQAVDVAAAPPSGAPCATKLRVWTPKGGDKTLAAACSEDAGWAIGAGRAVALAKTVATVFDASTGKQLAAVPVDKPRFAKPEWARELVAAALAPSALALVSRGPQLPAPGNADPREDVLHQSDVKCGVDLSGACWNDFVVGVYALGTSVQPTWDLRVSNDRPTELAPQASGAIAFDHAGKRVLVGTTDGAIEIASSPTVTTIKRLHFAKILRIVVSPGDGWVFSEDTAGVQRVWKLP
jgi:hypothetical protein